MERRTKAVDWELRASFSKAKSRRPELPMEAQKWLPILHTIVKRNLKFFEFNHMSCSGQNSYMSCSGQNSYMSCSGQNSYMSCSGQNSYMSCSGQNSYMSCSGQNSYMSCSGQNSYMSCSGPCICILFYMKKLRNKFKNLIVNLVLAFHPQSC